MLEGGPSEERRGTCTWQQRRALPRRGPGPGRRGSPPPRRRGSSSSSWSLAARRSLVGGSRSSTASGEFSPRRLTNVVAPVAVGSAAAALGGFSVALLCSRIRRRLVKLSLGIFATRFPVSQRGPPFSNCSVCFHQLRRTHGVVPCATHLLLYYKALTGSPPRLCAFRRRHRSTAVVAGGARRWLRDSSSRPAAAAATTTTR